MPRQRPMKLARTNRHGPRIVVRLIYGHDYGILDGPEMTVEELRDAWFTLREVLMDRNQSPASLYQGEPEGDYFDDRPMRPWAWWRFEAPEPRRQVNPGPLIVPGGELWFGMPARYAGIPPGNMFESEREYLARLGLLIEGE